MCGIVGHIGTKNTKNILLDGLQELEYRGYDSAGIAIFNKNNIYTYKAVGKLTNLEKKVSSLELNGFSIGIGHTRWATHGKPTEVNAHPHYGVKTYVVHNGIIENYQELKKELEKDGTEFCSQTDTEVFVHLFEKYQKKAKNDYEAFKCALSDIKGSYAILLMTESNSKTLFLPRKVLL